MRPHASAMTTHGTAATEQPRTAKKANRGRRRANRATTGGSSGSDGYESHQDDAVVEYHYRHPKRRVITAALFLWERVAAFSAPAQVAELERVSRDVARHLAESNTGTHLLQRYWNAQWSRMVWKDEELPEEKRYLAPAMLTRSDGKRSWKKVFVEEYPLYLERIYQGKGVRNNDMNEAKVLFHREVLNTAKTAKELQRLELTEEEARVKELRKRGVDVEVDETPGGAASPASPTGTHAVQTSKAEREKHEKGRPRAVAKAPHESYTRSDYKEDYRTGDRKGKHKKGGTGRWSNFDDFGDYSY